MAFLKKETLSTSSKKCNGKGYKENYKMFHALKNTGCCTLRKYLQWESAGDFSSFGITGTPSLFLCIIPSFSFSGFSYLNYIAAL